MKHETTQKMKKQSLDAITKQSVDLLVLYITSIRLYLTTRNNGAASRQYKGDYTRQPHSRSTLLQQLRPP